MKRILCVIDSLGSGGAQRQIVELAIGFKNRGSQVSLLTYHNLNFYKKYLDENNIEVITITEANYFKRIWKIRRFIRRGQFTSVLSFLDGANLYCELAGFPFKNWKLVVGERSANPNILKSVKARFCRFFHVFSDYVVANSFENIKIVCKANPFLSKEKCKVVYNIVDLEKWSPEENYVPKRNGRFKLIIAASHQKLKNLNGLVEAVKYMPSGLVENLDIEWYGDRIVEPYFDNSFREALAKIANSNLQNVFKFYPATHELNGKMKHADAIGLFSHYEGLPNAICEGMATGKPIIATNVSDLPLLINSEMLSNSFDSLAIMNSLVRIMAFNEEELTNIGIQNRNFALMNFDRSKIISDYLNLL